MKIKEYRKALGLSQRELGEMVGASTVSISLYENGKQSPDVNMLTKIADALHTSVDAIVDHNMEVENDEAMEFRDQIRNNPAYRELFYAAKKAKPKSLKAAAAVIKSLEGERDAD